MKTVDEVLCFTEQVPSRAFSINLTGGRRGQAAIGDFKSYGFASIG